MYVVCCFNIMLARVNCIVMKSTGEEFASCATDGSVFIWNIKGTPVSSMLQPTSFRSCAYSYDGTQLVAVGGDKKIYYMDVASGTLLREFDTGNTSELCMVSTIYHDGQEYVVTAGADRTVKVRHVCVCHYL